MFRYVYRSWQFFTAHCWVVKPFEMDHQYFWKTINSELFFEAVYFFALCAFVATLVHLLWCYVVFKAFFDRNVPSNSYWFSRYAYTQIHEVVERETFVPTSFAGYGAAKLTFEYVSYDWVVTSSKVLEPCFWLLSHGFAVTVNCLVWWLFRNSVKLIMHPIEKLSQKFLSILLSIPIELFRHFWQLIFEITGRYRSSFSLPRLFQKVAVGLRQIGVSEFLLALEVSLKVFG